ncbi:MAG: S41 family peptidase [Armatimonadota bacterium]
MKKLNSNHLILILGLVFFVAGYSARIHTINLERTAIHKARMGHTSMPGVSVASTQLEGARDIDFGPLEIMLTVLRNVREHYVDSISPADEGRMARTALTDMLASLEDPNTRFLEPEQYKLVEEAAQGRYHGIGAILGIKKVKNGNIQDEHLVVITPVHSGPAEKAGIRQGDDILAVDGREVLPLDPFRRASKVIKEERKKTTDKNILKKQIESETKRIETGIPILKAERLLTSEDDKEFELTVAREGSLKPFKVKVRTRSLAVEPVSYTLNAGNQIGYIKINCFSTRAPEQFAQAIKELNAKDAKGLLLDLRCVAAGDLDATLSLAKFLIPGRVFGIEHKSRGRKVPMRVYQYPAESVWSGPVVVLVNAGTAKMAEALAVALKDNLSAKIVGEPTYGDASIVTLFELRDGYGITMTTGKLLPLRSKDFHGKGVLPDIVIKSSAAEQLKEATKVLQSMIRSGSDA